MRVPGFCAPEVRPRKQAVAALAAAARHCSQHDDQCTPAAVDVQADHHFEELYAPPATAFPDVRVECSWHALRRSDFGRPRHRSEQITLAICGLVEDAFAAQDRFWPAGIDALEPVRSNARSTGELTEVGARDFCVGVIERIDLERHVSFLCIRMRNTDARKYLRVIWTKQPATAG